MNPSEPRNCEHFEPLLSSYLLLELTVEERAEVARHAASCEACRNELDLLGRTVDVLAKGAAPADPLSAGRRQAILQAAGSAPRQTAARRRTLVYWAGGLAAAAAALVVAAVPFLDVARSRRGGGPADGPLADGTLADSELAMAPQTGPAPATTWERAGGAGAPSPAPAPAGAEIAMLDLDATRLLKEKADSLELRTLARAPERVPLPEQQFWKVQQEAGAAGADDRRGFGLVAAGQEPGTEVRDRKEADFFAFDPAPTTDLALKASLEPESRAGGGKSLTESLDLAMELKRKTVPEERELRKLNLAQPSAGPRGADAGLVAAGADGLMRKKEGASRRARGEGLAEVAQATPLVEDLVRLQEMEKVDSAAKFDDGKDLTRNTLRFMEEFAKELDPVRFKKPDVNSPPAPRQDPDHPLRVYERSKHTEGREAPLGPQTADKAKQLEAKGIVAPALPVTKLFAVPQLTAEKAGVAGESPPAVPGGAQLAETLTDAVPAPTSPAQPPAKAGAGLAQAPVAAPPGPATTPAGSRPAPTGAAPAPGASLATVAPAVDWKARVDDFLSRLDRVAGETPDHMLFRYWGDNPYVEASTDALSTFAVDVDTASYTIFRSYLYKQNVLPPREAVRTEEIVNYFKGGYAPPTDVDRAFAVHTDAAPSPFAHEPDYKLLRVGIKGREVSREKRKAAALVFVVDTSGSMRRENRLELVKEAIRLLVKELDEGDSIGIVAFDRDARTILEPTPASQKERILDAIATLLPNQNTNVAAGLELGFRMAGAHFLKDGTNRVILLSDGVANTGNLDQSSMLEQVRAQRERGVYLTTVGVGMGNLNDVLLEQLADRGNGQCVYVDRIEEARKAFVDNLTGTLEAIARDVKVQVEFDPAKVLRYRLLGYENRAVADSAFRDNKVDAGEIGAGHEVTALYELKLRPDATGKLATVRVRHLTVEHGEAQEIEHIVDAGALKGSFADASPRFRLAACTAELAEVLRDSYWARSGSLDRVAALLAEIMDLPDGASGAKLGADPDLVELLALVRKADALVRRRQSETDDIARTVDLLKENYYIRARYEDLERNRRDGLRSELERIQDEHDRLRHRLESLLAEPK